MLGVTDDLIEERDEARAEVARLREEQDTFLSGHVATLQHQLAAANTLLEQATYAVDEACYPVWWEAYRAHLSGAAPAQTVTVQSGAGPVEVTREHLDAMNRGRAARGMPALEAEPAEAEDSAEEYDRLKAEQAVLDAMRDAVIHQNRGHIGMSGESTVRVCRAELARRGVKP